MTIELTARQEALLRLPEPDGFTRRIAQELRRDTPEDVQHFTDARLLEETRLSYEAATNELQITRIPTLVRWAKLDVVSHGTLHREPAVQIKLRSTKDPNVTAEDLLMILRAQTHWGS